MTEGKQNGEKNPLHDMEQLLFLPFLHPTADRMMQSEEGNKSAQSCVSKNQS